MAASSDSSSRLLRLLWIAGIFGAVLLAYSPALRAGFIWDDNAHVTKPELRSAAGLWRIWTEIGATQQYYPALHTAFWLEHRLWGSNPKGYHLANLALHALAAVLLGRLLRRLDVRGAWLVAGVFALHPVHVESAAWISEQKNTLSAVLYLGAALAYLRFAGARDAAGRSKFICDPVRDAGPADASQLSQLNLLLPRSSTARLYWLGTLLFIFALLSKTVTATLPAALLVLIWWRRGAISWRRDVIPLLPWFALALAAGLLTAWIERTIIGAEGAAFELTGLQRVLLAGHVVWFYAGKLLWPANLTFIYPRWTIDPTAPLSWLPLAAALALLAALWAIRHRSRAPLAAALLFGGTLFPVLGFFNVYPFQYSFVADHFQYLASIPLIVVLVGTALRAVRGRLGEASLPGLLMLVALGVHTHAQSRIYRDSATLFRATLARNPDAWMAHNNLAQAIMTTTGDRAQAIEHLQRAVALRPDYPEALNNLGLALAQAGRAEEGLALLERSLRLKPNLYETHNNRGIALVGVGRIEEAVEAFRRAAALNPTFPNIHENLGKLLQHLGREAEAEQHFATARRLRERPR